MTLYFHRYIEDDILKSLKNNKIVILLGARQTGKSTLLNKILPLDTIKINFQDIQKRQEFSQNPLLLRQILSARSENQLTVFIDEVQKIPQILEEVQYLYDQNKGKYQFVLTGSSARKLIKQSYNLLPGRSHVYYLYPITEVERGVPGVVSNMPFSKEPLFPKESLDNLLLYGSLPGIFFEDLSSKTKTLQSYKSLYLEEEIRQEFTIKEIGRFANFLELAALSSGKPISLAHLSNEVGLSIPTINSYYQILVDTYVGYWLPAFTKNIRKRVLSRPKFFFFDNGLKNACAKLSFSPDLLKVIGGELFEHWVGLELYHKTKLLGPEYGLYYYRSVSGVEIDFIMSTPKEIIPIEVKWSENPNHQDIKQLEKFIIENPNANKGYLICRVSEPRQLSENILALPWDQF